MFRYASTIVCGAVLILGGIIAIMNGKTMAEEANAALAWLEPLAGIAYGLATSPLVEEFGDSATRQQRAEELAATDAELAELRQRAQMGSTLFYGGICAVIVGPILVLAGLGSGLAFRMKR